MKKRLLAYLLKGTNMVAVDVSEYADIKMRAFNTARVEPMSRAELAMEQLGSYVPNFKPLNGKPEAFRNAIGLMCMNIMRSNEWQYLITHLKQDQVNSAFFVEGVTSDDKFVRGSINGIYIVDEQITLLGRNYEERMNAKVI